MHVRGCGLSGMAAVILFSASLFTAGCGQERVEDRAPVRPQTGAVAPPQASEPPAVDAIPFTPAPAAYAGELPPLPRSPYAPPRPPELIRAVYTFAARHPEVLHYVPCFCGCQRSGHKDNDDCFIQGRERDGRPIWDPHGMT